MKRHRNNFYTVGLNPSEKFFSKMQSRRGRRDRTVFFGINRLVPLPILSFVNAVIPMDIRRQGRFTELLTGCLTVSLSRSTRRTA